MHSRLCLISNMDSLIKSEFLSINKKESSSSQQGRAAGVKDLRSRGLCLVPISLTQHVGNENGGDYWAPAALGSGF